MKPNLEVLRYCTLKLPKHYQLHQWNGLTSCPPYEVISKLIHILPVWLLTLLAKMSESLVIGILTNLVSPQYCSFTFSYYNCVLWGENSIGCHCLNSISSPAACIAYTPFGHFCCVAILLKVANDIRQAMDPTLAKAHKEAVSEGSESDIWVGFYYSDGLFYQKWKPEGSTEGDVRTYKELP